MNAPMRRPAEESSTSSAEAQEIHTLLKLLVNKICGSPSLHKTRRLDGGAREIILDTDVDGVRCLLVRIDQQLKKPHVDLSPREQAIARMVAEGYGNKTIAAILDISTWTVGTHLRRVFAKLGVGSRAAMVAHLIENGVLVEHLDKKDHQKVR